MAVPLSRVNDLVKHVAQNKLARVAATKELGSPFARLCGKCSAPPFSGLPMDPRENYPCQRRHFRHSILFHAQHAALRSGPPTVKTEP